MFGRTGFVDTIDFRQLFSTMPGALVLLDREFRIVEMSEAYLQVTHRKRPDLVGRSILDAFPETPERLNMLRTSIARARDEGVVDHLALIAYEIETPEGRELRYWSATHTPVRDGTGFVKFVLQQTQDVTELEQLRAAVRSSAGGNGDSLGSDVLRRAAVVQTLNTSLSAESAQLRQLFMEAPSFMAVLRGPEHVFEMANEAYQTLVGRRDIIGKSISDALPEVMTQGFVGLLDEVRRSGKAYVGTDSPVTLVRHGREELVYLNFVYQPIRDADGGVSGVFVEGFDVTERVRAEAQQRLLLDELNHRVKNTLATVQAIALQTMKNGAPDSAALFQARLASLARTHATLTRDHWTGADLTELLESELSAFADGRARLDGPHVHLSPREALALGLVLHELATNATKYGALSAPGGRVDVHWSQAGERLEIVWRELGGPPVAPPGRTGFGGRLIKRTIEDEMKGDTRMEFEPEGLHARLIIPIKGASA